MPNALIDINGQRFGRWTVLRRAPNCKHNRSKWLCRCDCGREREVDSKSLRIGHSQSCGICNRKSRTHGLSGTQQFFMWGNAKRRAKAADIPFDIKVTDIVIPTHCPCLGVPLEHGTRSQKDNSPSLDRIIPKLGYVKSNIWVISARANRIKNDATAEEIIAVGFAILAGQEKKSEQKIRR